MSLIDSKELKTRLENGTDLVLLDVRENDELTGEYGHLPGIVHIPLGQLPVRMGELDKDRARTIVSICKASGRAARAAELLGQAGFKNVLVLTGGMIEWNNQGLPVETTR